VRYTVREYRAEDFDVVWAIDQTCFPPGISYSRQELKFYLRRPGSFALVAENADGLNASNVKSGPATAPAASIAGFIVAEAGGRGSGHIITIDVIGNARRSGVGSLLLSAAEERLNAAGCRTVALETAVDNLSALSFYKRHGYSVTRTFPRYYSNGVDALVLAKSLSKEGTRKASVR
jgi:[ribosomal protein S18]-alanine N-acetyltransferase